MADRSTHHDTFIIKRSFDAAPPRVFNAFADPASKTKWFGGPDDWSNGVFKSDFRVGGQESTSGGPTGGPVHHYKATFQDIVPNERIVYTYEMHMDEIRISISLATVQLEPNGTGTRMIYTEQCVFLDGYDNAGQREQGSNDLFEALSRSLEVQ